MPLTSRHHGWQGWHDLMPLLPSRPLRILDLGCGNGRLAEFLDRTAEAHDPVASYVGRDRCEAYSCSCTRKNGLFSHAFRNMVVVRHAWKAARETPKPEYDWVTLFGVMHHVYGYAARLELLHWASRWLRPGGLLSVSFWNFGASEQFLRKTIPWSDMATQWGLDETTLEDYLLGWSGHRDTPRYCHWVSPEEQNTAER